MLPPIAPHLVTVPTQQDLIKPVPALPVVAPVESTPQENDVSFEKRNEQEAEELLWEEQRRRRQRRGYSAAELAEGEVAEEDQALIEQLPRQGLWVDVEV
ncbi:aspartate-semialdehyde dehydrogenase [Pseudomonas sp. GV071]|jgi:hypothetical protein|uniref:aspartate-semialdehyde dehydrogenase n=1 Tax=Pseudomonas sp. GV071 TaxID=2135754 RepID=UPI000D3DA041|nr:aspartate-semialdehyde dehydrogenase [Pseudomonas sp. GV071]PTQ73598.1 hypothetical protein C8K61_10116 [Pseudomonas sp. GV071]